MKRVLPAVLLVAVAIAVFLLTRDGDAPAKVGPGPQDQQQAASSGEQRSAEPTAERSAVNPAPPVELPASRESTRPFVLTGRITPDRHAPLAGARMRAHRGAPDDRELSFSSVMAMTAPGQPPSTRDFTLAIVGAAVAEAPLDVDGRFRIDGLRYRDLRLVLDDDFYGLEQTLVVHAPADATEIDLGTLGSHCGALIRGRVVGIADGAHADIDLALDADPMDFIRNSGGFMSRALQGGGRRAPVTDDRTFVFRAVSPAPSATLTLDCDAAVAPAQRLVLGPGETHEVIVVAHRGTDLRVHVTDLAGAPLVDASILAMPADMEGEFAVQRAMRRKETDAAGIAVLTALREGRWSVIARCSGYLPQDSVQTVDGSASTTLEIHLDPGAAIAGTVVDTEGKPIADAHVGKIDDFEVPVMGKVSSMVGAETWALQVMRSPFTTDAEGHFKITGIPDAKPSSLAAWHPEFLGGIAADVAAGSTDARIVMTRPARAKGRVVDDATGEPLREFDARTVETMALVMERPTAIAALDKTVPGSFTFAALPVRKTTLRISAEGFANLERSIEPSAGGELDLGELRLVREAHVRGRILDHDGRGVSGATVTEFRRGIQGNPMMQSLLDDKRAVSRSDGSYELAGVRIGTLELKATHGDFASGRSRRVTVTAGQTVEGVDITLASGGTIHGKLLFAPGQIASEWQVFATLEMQAATYATKPAADGTFVLEHLDPGRYDVQAINGKGIQRMQTESRADVLAGRSLDIGKFIRAAQEMSITQRVQVREGEDTEVEIDVAELDDGGGQLGVEVRVGGHALDSGMLEATDANGVVAVGFVQKGQCAFRRLAAGPASFQVRSGLTMSPVGAPQTVQIDSGDAAQHIVIDLPGGSIDGTVVDAERGEPIARAVVRLVAVGSGKEGRGADVGFALTDGEGRFAFRGLAEGRFGLFADDMFRAHGGDAVGRIDDIDVGAGAEVKGLVLRAHRGAGIRIEVVDDLGQPVPHARTLAVAPDGSPLGSLPFALTDDAGIAELTGLAGGATRVVAWASGLAPGASDIQQLDEHARADFRVALPHGPDTEVRILDSAGEPLGHAALSVRFGKGPWLPSVLLLRSVDGDGRIDIGPMPSTTVEFSVRHPRASYVVSRTVGGGARTTIVLRP